MIQTDMAIQEVDFSQVSSADIDAWVGFDRTMNCEAPLMPYQLSRLSLNSLPGHIATRLFVARNSDGQVLGEGRCVWRPGKGSKLSTSQIHISILESERRRGLGKTLLQKVTEACKAAGRRRLIAWSTDRLPAGRTFLERGGGKPIFDLVLNRLRMPQLDQDLLERWRARAASDLQREYRLVPIDQSYPDAYLKAIVGLRAKGLHGGSESEIAEASMTTFEEARDLEATLLRGRGRMAMVALYLPHETVAGFTEVSWHPGDPALGHQGGTVVDAPHRRRGLGTWLKAALLQRVHEQQPGIREIRTGNASDNESILRINRALGFETLLTGTAWNVPLEKARTFAATANLPQQLISSLVRTSCIE
jgi:mycothiol synthase